MPDDLPLDLPKSPTRDEFRLSEIRSVSIGGAPFEFGKTVGLAYRTATSGKIIGEDAISLSAEITISHGTVADDALVPVARHRLHELLAKLVTETAGWKMTEEELAASRDGNPQPV